MIIKVDVKFMIRQVVYLKTDPDQCPRIVTGILIKNEANLYELCCGVVVSNHYDFEISDAKTYDFKAEA